MEVTNRSIQHPMHLDTGLGKIAEEVDLAARIEQWMRQVLLTNPGERINRPTFGCGVRRMLFAPNNIIAANLAQLTVHQALEQSLDDWIDVEQVTVEMKEERLSIGIRYLLKAYQDRRYLNVEVAP